MRAFAQRGLPPWPATQADYITQAESCLQAIRKGAPAVRLAGPDTIDATRLSPCAAAMKGAVSLLGERHYPMSSCDGPSGNATALLSLALGAKEATAISNSQGFEAADHDQNRHIERSRGFVPTVHDRDPGAGRRIACGNDSDSSDRGGSHAGKGKRRVEG